MSSESYEGVAVLKNQSHAAIIELSYGLTHHVIALRVRLDDGFEFDVRRPFTARGPRPVLRGDVISAQARDEHERSFDLFIDDELVGNVRLGQRVVLTAGERHREVRGFGLAKAAA